jgi:hypothetical protein
MTRLRLGLGLAGLLLAALAVALDSPRAAWGAIALLAASLIVRLLARRGSKGDL